MIEDGDAQVDVDDEEDVADPEADAFLQQVARIDDLPAPDGELRRGDRLAHFVIGAKLGAGAMGAVYDARDDKLGRTVAIKVMRRASDDARARFLQEARAAAAVAHPNLVTVHEIGEASGRAFIVMERIRGTTLRGVRAVDDEALVIVRAIAAGLGAAHAAGIVHRDLKPDNVMRTEDGTIKILDFGIARIAPDEGLAVGTPAATPPMTGTGVIVGTPSYMSPEQALGRPVDARTDIYSFGVLATELVTGHRPAADATLPAGPLSAILGRCLHADPAQRPRDGGELLAALQGVGTSGAGAARPPKGRTLRRLVLAAVAIVLVVGGAIGWRLAHRSSRPAPRGIVADEHVRTKNAEARDAYRGAFMAFHDAQYFEAVRGFKHAVELDPTFAAAHLRLALLGRWYHSHDESRHSFEIAVQHRDDLDARDRALLEASEPAVMRDPYDYRESLRRFTALVAAYPDDAELLFWLGMNYSEVGEHERLKPLMDKMASIDPASAVVQAGRAMTLFYLGDRRGAREAAIECRRVAPTQSTCAFELQKILNDLGDCDELETVLRAWMIASPEEPRPAHALAELMLATGRPRAAVDEMFEQARARLPESERAAAKADDDDILNWTTGDFVKMPPFHGPVRDALDRIDLATETGDLQTARSVAEQFMAKRSALGVEDGTSDADLFGDPTGEMLATLARTGAITHDELVREREAWVHELDSRIGGIYRRMIWAKAYAVDVETPEEAADALAALPRYEPLPPTYWFPYIYGRIGRTFVLGGRAADGLPYLERATKRCVERDPRDFFYLGLGQEALGDTASACTAYREVITRWGAAKPRSVTAEKAQQRLAALHCRP